MLVLPRTAVLEITPRCNHKCLFCSCPWEHSVARPENELSENEWKQIIDTYRYYGVSHITFTGGEPTIREDLPALIECAYKAGYTLGLVSNGRSVETEFLKFLKAHKVLLSISVPGIKTFYEHTGVDNIDSVLSLFSLCKKLGLDSVANIAVTKKNIGELYENISYPILYGASYVLLNRFLPGGRGMKNTELLLNKDEINEMLDIAEAVLERAGIKGHIGTELPYCVIKRPNKYKSLSVGSLCGAGKEFFVTDPEGYIKVCNHSPNRVCRWSEIQSIEKNEYWQRFATRNYLPKKCDGCEHLNICDGGCREAAHVYFGEIDKNDPCMLGE